MDRILEFVKSENPKTANITYVPILSKQVFRSGQHEDDANRNPNQRIPHDPSDEMRDVSVADGYVASRWLLEAS